MSGALKHSKEHDVCQSDATVFHSGTLHNCTTAQLAPTEKPPDDCDRVVWVPLPCDHERHRCGRAGDANHKSATSSEARERGASAKGRRSVPLRHAPKNVNAKSRPTAGPVPLLRFPRPSWKTPASGGARCCSVHLAATQRSVVDRRDSEWSRSRPQNFPPATLGCAIAATRLLTHAPEERSAMAKFSATFKVILRRRKSCHNPRGSSRRSHRANVTTGTRTARLRTTI